MDELDKKWEKRWGLISEHLSHPNPSNRKDRRTEKRENPRWDVEIWHHELLDALETVAEQHKSEYSHHALLVDLLKAAKSKPIAGEVLTTQGISAEESTDSKGFTSA